ncbi:MAG TPA: sugar nucleotide-binding protein, partial [Bacteroidales bacterium]|nr:sugar nucleotide-binding protein [Bacteroidales bacterium]
MKTKILVTGSNGQLGNELRLLSAHLNHLSFVFTDVTELDITQPEAVNEIMESLQPQYLINCAAYTAVDKAESEKESAWKINAIAPEILANSARKTGTCLIHISSDYVFDGQNYRPYLPSHPTHPLSWYG